MNAHLTPQEFVEALDEALAASRRDHLERCPSCRAELGTLRAVVEDVRPAGDVRPPSPLFWDHFAGRVRVAVDVEPPRPSARWRFAWQALAATGGVAVLAALVVLFLTSSAEMPGIDRVVMVESAPPPIAVPATPDAPVDRGSPGEAGAPEPDESSPAAVRSWERVVSAGRGASAEDVHSVVPVDPAAALLIEDLSQRELQEFARLIRAQMGGVQ